MVNQNSIAVLPFINRSSDPENEYFSDGVTEEIINALAKIDALNVISRTSSFYFKEKDIPLREIAAQLNAQTILEGSVRVAHGQVRISAHLIQVNEDIHLWSETWDRKLENIFAIQDEISLLIADKLREQLGHFEIAEHLLQEGNRHDPKCLCQESSMVILYNKFGIIKPNAFIVFPNDCNTDMPFLCYIN